MANIAKKESTELQQYSVTNASSMMSLANELANFIKEKKLTQAIQGKEYVLVEAWTYAGMSMGLAPVMTSLEKEVGKGEEIKYRATVELMNLHTGAIVGRAFAICSNLEPTKKYFQEYAIASMAQTRAVGKVYRLPLGWLMKAAGYESTPAEELADAVVVEEEKKASKPVKPVASEPAKPDRPKSIIERIDEDYTNRLKAELPNGLLETIEGAVSREELLEIWSGNKALQLNEEFTAAITKAKDNLPDTHPMQNPNAVPVSLKTEILLLLNNGVFDAQEKQKFVDAIKRRDSETETGKAKLWAETVIAKLKGQISERSQKAA